MTLAQRDFEIDERRRAILGPIMSVNPAVTTEEAIKLLNGQVALSEKTRINRLAMNLEQLNRRKQLINHSGGDVRGETTWLDTCIDALEGLLPETKVSDLLHVGRATKGRRLTWDK